ncbi:hypothetical protein QWY85_02690 [Neolewinella lacunae]|uniref:Outer membrane protein beta-barrel domain-containing protein n=1 Tax=Neolewinella lacunae TaxID=1517758 RepID=A0A923T7B1_9BACT|nr:hypothetical protein [Neolewinella lacunae]MBC6992668.1 hypothetical protein [Neolewinella lacunae]MDN3633548.1 hypothetical protein [Neolewinella lacunae]
MLKQLLLLLVLCAVALPLSAQTTEEREAQRDLDYYNQDRNGQVSDNGGSFGGQLWYGAGAQLGFFSNNFESIFQIGLSPIVGYKINNIFSVGPRGSFAYNAYRQTLGGGVPDFKAKYWTWSAGAFARAKIGFTFFAHAEYSLLSEVNSFDINGDPLRSTRAIPFLGGGISQGGGPGLTGFEILILFRLTQADRIGDSPYQFRTGINYNF